MKKISMILVIILCMSALVGCSGKDSLGSIDGKVYSKDKVIDVDEISPEGATKYLKFNADQFPGIEIPEQGIPITYKPCVGIEDCPNNINGIAKKDCKKYKKALYFSINSDTQVMMHTPIGDDKTVEAAFTAIEFGMINIAELTRRMYEASEYMTFGTATELNYNNKVFINVEEIPDYKVRPTEIVVPGMLRVCTGTKKCETPAKIGEVNVVKTSTSNFDYYQYGDILIQTAQGVDPSAYITLK